MIKKVNFGIQLVLILLASLMVSTTAFSAKKSAQPLDKIAAVVNEEVITESELDEAISTTKKQILGSNVTLPPSDVLRKQVLDQMINKKLQLALATQMGIQVTDADIDKTIAMIAKGNNVPVSALYEKVTSEGVSLSEYRKDIREQLILQKVQQQSIGNKITISPQEVADFTRSKHWQDFNSQEYHLEDILITMPEAPSPQDVADAKKRADELIVKLRHGLSFSEAAAAESGEKNALQGGDLGWRKLPEIPSAFANEIVHKKTNDIIGPIQTPNGFHIIRLAGVRTIGKQPSTTERQNQVEQLIFQRKLEEALQSWITRLRSEAFINTNPEKL